MKIKKFNLFITSDINSPGKSISFTNLFIYACIFTASLVLFFSFFGFYYLFFYDNVIKNEPDLTQLINKEIIVDSLYFSQDPVKNSSNFDSPIITSSFQSNHKAIDITGPIGTKIYSVMPGKVFYEGNDKKMGNVIVISHKNGYITKYMHNKENFVQTGESISLNKPIAEMGKTGSVLSKKEGIHLHFELWEDGNPINPFPFIKELDLIDSNLSELKK